MKIGDRVKTKLKGGKVIEFIIDDIVCDKLYDSDGIWSFACGCELIKDKQPTPKRYATDSIDVIDFCKLYNLNFNLGNVVKYTCRDKGTDIEDYKKAIDYLQREINHLKSLE